MYSRKTPRRPKKNGRELTNVQISSLLQSGITKSQVEVIEASIRSVGSTSEVQKIVDKLRTDLRFRRLFF